MQLFTTMGITNETSRGKSLAKLNTYISEISSWLGSSLMKLGVNNPDVLILASSRYIHAVIENVMHLGHISLSSSQFVSKLGVILHQTLSTKRHITHICKSSIIQLQIIKFSNPIYLPMPSRLWHMR